MNYPLRRVDQCRVPRAEIIVFSYRAGGVSQVILGDDPSVCDFSVSSCFHQNGRFRRKVESAISGREFEPAVRINFALKQSQSLHQAVTEDPTCIRSLEHPFCTTLETFSCSDHIPSMTFQSLASLVRRVVCLFSIPAGTLILEVGN